MPKLRANELEIEYDTFGDPGGRPLLMIMGLGAQMILWDEEFCAMLADAGHYVVRFDNRDVGLSDKLDGHAAPSLLEIVPKILAGEEVEVPYRLSDMASDAAGVLDALEIESAHVCGASMGGMIAQSVAIQHPKRVRSLTSIMSTTGDPSVPPATPEAMAVLMEAPVKGREEAIDRAVRVQGVIGGKGFPVDEPRIRERAARIFDRCFYPQGMARHMSAIAASGSRSEALARLDVPTLVIHGADDPLVPVEGGHATAAAIPGAELLLIEGMGHDLPMPVWPRISEAVAKLTDSAEGAIEN